MDSDLPKAAQGLVKGQRTGTMNVLDEGLTRPKLKVISIGKSYQGKRVVRDVSFEVSCGEIIGILGPNGAGKTTSFYMVMGLVMPEQGQILLEDIDITLMPMYQRSRLGIGYLPQEPSIFRGLNVEQNILAILELVVGREEERTKRLEELLGEFSITHLRYVPSMSLSGGERRRLEIARALASNPRFLLLDEPLAGIDPIAVGELKGLVWHLKEKGIGIIITDHNVREALDIIDRAYIIHEGKVLVAGTPKDIINSKQAREIYLGDNFRY